MTIPEGATQPRDHLAPAAANDLRTLDEVAAYLRKTPGQMRWLRYAGTGPKSAKIGGRVMYRQRDVDAWLDAQFENDPANTAA